MLGEELVLQCSPVRFCHSPYLVVTLSSHLWKWLCNAQSVLNELFRVNADLTGKQLSTGAINGDRCVRVGVFVQPFD